MLVTKIEWATPASGGGGPSFTNISESNTNSPSSPNVVLGPASGVVPASDNNPPFIYANTNLKIEKQLQFAGSTQIVCYDYLGQYTWNQQGNILIGDPYGGLNGLKILQNFPYMTLPHPNLLIDPSTILGIRNDAGINTYNANINFDRGSGQVLTSKEWWYRN